MFPTVVDGRALRRKPAGMCATPFQIQAEGNVVLSGTHFGRDGMASGPRWVAMGMFDGVHLGHARVVRGALAGAREAGAVVAAVVFDPHPRSVLPGRTVPMRLQTSEERAEALMKLGVEEVFEFRFDGALSGLGARPFCAVLSTDLAMCGITVGTDFRFGYCQAGNVESLHAFGQEMGFTVRAVEERMDAGEIISSTRIRRHLAEGQVDRANSMLGRPYSVAVAACCLPRLANRPALNLLPSIPCLLASGEYAADLKLGDGQRFPVIAAVDGPSELSISFVQCLPAHVLMPSSAANIDFHCEITTRRIGSYSCGQKAQV